MVIPQGIGHIARRLPEIIEDGENGLPGQFRALLLRLGENLKEMDRQVGELEREIKAWHRQSEASRKLEEDSRDRSDHGERLGGRCRRCECFASGRQMAAWLGLVPRQHSTGGKPTLLGISKRGDPYLRMLLIHGARAVVRISERKLEADSWLKRLMGRRNKNIAAVALANKNARIAWALLRHDRQYAPDHTPALAME